MSQDFSIPEDFFIVLETLRINAMYDYEKKAFTWDFTPIISQFKPKSIYSAYQRYAHAEYTRLSLGTKESPLEKNAKKLKSFGNNKILSIFESCSIEKEYNHSKHGRSGTKATIGELIEDSLQVFPNGNPHNLGILAEIKKDVLGQIFQVNHGKQKGIEEQIFDHNDEVNIANAWDDLFPFISGNVSSKKEKAELHQTGLVRKVQLLFKVILDDSLGIHLNVKHKLSTKRIRTIVELYRKWRIKAAGSLDEFDDKENDKKHGKDTGSLYKDPENIILEKARGEFIIKLFDEEFKGSLNFLKIVYFFILNESKSHLDYEIDRYRKIGKHNINSELFFLFCKANKIEPGSKIAKDIHSQFADSLEKIAERLYEQDNKDREQESKIPKQAPKKITIFPKKIRRKIDER